MELILNTFGTSLNRDNEGFVVTNKDGRQRVPTIGIKSIQVGKGTQVTSDAIMLAIENEIDVVFVDRQGMPKGRVWSYQYGSISTIRKGQLNFTYDSDAVTWIKDILAQKISNQQATLLMLPESTVSAEEKRNAAISRMESYRNKILEISEGTQVCDIATQLRGLEGSASRLYFDTINYFIPEKYQFSSRSQHPAYDIFNALLNYGYGCLYGRIEGALIKAGVDPYIGLLHRDDYNRPALVFDVIEIYRIWVDYVVLNLINQNIVTDDFYSVGKDGSYWLEQLGRRVLIQSLNDYLEETITMPDSDNPRSRNTQITLYAQKLAQRFLSYT